MKKNLQKIAAILLAGVIISTMVSCGSKNIDMSLIPVKSGEKWQYITPEGKIEINPQFSKAGYFIDGLAKVRTSGEKELYGFIDKKGAYVINATYKEATDFSEGLACVVAENGAPTYIDTKGEVKFKLEKAQYASNFVDGMAQFSTLDKEGKELWGYINTSGEVVIKEQFYQASPFMNGLAAVANKDGKWGFINKKGEMVINYQFKRTDFFSDGLAAFEDEKGKEGYIDTDGKIKINPQYDNAYSFMGGSAVVKDENDKSGYIDAEGKFKINPQFEDAFPFIDGLAAVKSNGKWGYISDDGKFKINPQFEEAAPFVDGKAFVSSGDKWGIVDKEGKFTVNPQFERVNYFDLISWIYYEGHVFGMVRTDFFDIKGFTDPLTSQISPAGVLGISPTTTLADVMSKYQVTEDKLYSFLPTVSVDTVIGSASVYLSIDFDRELKTYQFESGGYVVNKDAKVTGVRMGISPKKLSFSEERMGKVMDALKEFNTTKLGLKAVDKPAGETSSSYDIDSLLDTTSSASKDKPKKPSTMYFENDKMTSKIKSSSYSINWEIGFKQAAPATTTP